MKYLKQIIAASIAGMVCMTAYSDEVPVGAITGLYQEKTAVPNEDGESYKLTIDSYAVGSMVTEQTTTCLNADVVLVIDMSSSMFNSKKTVSDPDTTQYYCNDSNQAVAYKNGGWKHYVQSSKKWENESGTIKQCGYSAVLTAATKFINNLRKDAKLFPSVSHKVKILSFGPKNYVGDWCKFTDVKDNYDDVITALLTMEKKSDTYPAMAMDSARSALDSSSGDTKNIVFFTDGKPETTNGEGGQTINKALTAKGKGYSVFSIGYGLSSTEYQYLEAVSSDFPSASATISGDSYTIQNCAETNRKDDFYMRNTSDPMELTEYFEAVARSIAHAAKIYNLTTSTQIRDYITPDFKIKDWTSAKVKCYKVACTGFDSNNNPTFVGGGSTDITSTLTIDIPNDSVIKVSGFDFKANVCGKNSKTGAVYGNKLSIVFDIVPTATFKGGFNLDTNTPASGIYESNDTKADTIGTYPIPKVAAPVDLIVTASNLKYGESLLVTVTRDTTSAGTNKGKDGFKYELMLTGTQLEKQILKKVATKYKNYNDSATYYYFVEPQETDRTKSKSWDWRYDKTSNAPSHPLWDAKGDSLINVFPFTRTERTGIQSSDEDWSTSKKTH